MVVTPGRRRLRPSRAAALLLIAGLASGLSGPAAHGDTSLSGATSKLHAIVARIDQAARQRDLLRSQMAALLSQVGANARALEATQREIDDVGAGIAALRAQVAQEHADLDRRAAEAYMSGPIPSLGVALGTTSIADFQTVMEYLDASARSDRELVDRLTTRNTELWRQEARLASLRGHLQATRDGLDQEARSMSDRLNQQLAVMAGLQRDRAAAQALVADLTDERDRLAAQAAIDRAGGNPGPPPKPDPLPPDPGPAAVRQLVIDDFTPLGQDQVDIALCVADRESSFDPHALNPVSGAAGVFQFLPSTWDTMSGPAGWGGHSVFEAAANVGTAEWTVANYGWGAWSGDGTCGI